MKRVMLIIIIQFLIMNLIILCGCIEEKKEIDSLDIHISNGTNRIYNATLSLNNSKGIEIFNKSFSVDPDEQLDYIDITEKIGNYVLTIKLDDDRIRTYDNIVVNEFRHGVSIHLDYDEIHITQKVE